MSFGMTSVSVSDSNAYPLPSYTIKKYIANVRRFCGIIVHQKLLYVLVVRRYAIVNTHKRCTIENTIHSNSTTIPIVNVHYTLL